MTAARDLVACVDFGSTFTKAALVNVRRGRLVARAEHPTTLATDVMDGWEACRADLVATEPAAAEAEVLACSSAGGGLRIGVVGNEALVTAGAGSRVALSSGGRVVHVCAGPLDVGGLEALREARPDVLLLVGGTDGGNRAILRHNAAELAREGWPGPVVVAGNRDVRVEATRLLADAGTPAVVADNVVPRIGVLAPAGARRAIRDVFLRHVIGGKHLSRRAGFSEMVVGATPDLVLAAVELLAGDAQEGRGAGDVVVVDVGGATTDVYSVVEPVPDAGEPLVEVGGLSREVVPRVAATRTVEGDLGVRWSAPSTVQEARASGLLTEGEVGAALQAAERRQRDPAYLPGDPASRACDLRLAGLATQVALRRHAGRAQVRFDADPVSGPARGRWVERTGVDLRQVGLVVLSGGAIRHADVPGLQLADREGTAGGWLLPQRPRVVVDRDYVLAPAGLLAARSPQAALALLRACVESEDPHTLAP